MNSKKWIKIFVILSLIGVLFVSGINYIVDPYQQYRVKTFYIFGKKLIKNMTI